MSLYFTTTHQWIMIDQGGLSATVGISTHAQEALGDVVFVELPEIGKTIAQFEVGAVVESVKTAADVLMPLSGTVTAVNEALRSEPSLANTDPMGTGWFYKVTLEGNTDQERLALMDAGQYERENF